MSSLRVHGFSLSLDGFGAGTDQSLEQPLGRGGEDLHQWMFPTRTFQSLYGKGEGTTGIDDRFAARGFDNIGAWILGRNMFGPVRGPWPDERWKGWWGEEPPYRAPVFVLTHHARPPIEMKGGTIFHFRHRRHPRGTGPRMRGGGRQGHQAGRRRGDDPPIPGGEAGRRDAPCDLAGAARPGRGHACRAGPARTRLFDCRACRERRRDPCSDCTGERRVTSSHLTLRAPNSGTNEYQTRS